jgi:lysozyme
MNTQTNAWGIDVSHWHPVKDWAKLLATGASIFGAKATDGDTYVDSSFAGHRDGARAQPFKLCIWYHFARMTGAAAGQARRFLGVVGELEQNERVCLDFEEPSYGALSGAAIQGPAIHWIDEFTQTLLEQMPSRRPFLYTSDRIWRAIGNPGWTLAAEVDLWLPRYSSKMVEPAIPAPWNAWTLWQWSDGVTPPSVVDGIGPCDTNLWRWNAADLEAYMAGRGTFVGPVPKPVTS